jgi:hypothetical protein
VLYEFVRTEEYATDRTLPPISSILKNALTQADPLRTKLHRVNNNPWSEDWMTEGKKEARNAAAVELLKTEET